MTNLYYWLISFEVNNFILEPAEIHEYYKRDNELGESIQFDQPKEIQELLENGFDVHVIESQGELFDAGAVQAESGTLVFTSSNQEDERSYFFVIAIKEGQEAVANTDDWKLTLQDDSAELELQ